MIFKATLGALAAALAIMSSSANAALITLETRDLQGSFDNANYAAAWGALTSSISNMAVSEFTGIDTGNDTFAKLSVMFDLGEVQAVSFDFGLDAGLGYEVFVNNSSVAQNTNNVWWGGSNFANAFTVTLDPLASGSTTLELYWAENRNSGPQSIRFSADDGQTYQALSAANLEDAREVPVPSVVALMGLGLLMLGSRRRRK